MPDPLQLQRAEVTARRIEKIAADVLRPLQLLFASDPRWTKDMKRIVLDAVLQKLGALMVEADE